MRYIKVMASLAILLFVTPALSAEYVCTKNGRKVRNLTDCRVVATPTPMVTPGPTPDARCEAVGTKNFNLGEVHLMCWTETAKRPMIQIQAYNDADTSCASFSSQLNSPDGKSKYSADAGPAPSDVVMWAGPGRYSFWVQRNKINPDDDGSHCGTVVFWLQ